MFNVILHHFRKRASAALLLITACGAVGAGDAPRTDRHGDPLPSGAIARLGTVRWRHGFFVHRIAFSPDGKKIAAVGCGRAITMWDAATGKELCQFPNRGQPSGLAFSPDGKILATTYTPVCHLWDAATGKELRQLKGHNNSVSGVAFSPDGRIVATAGGDGTLRLWDPSTGEEKRRIDCGQGGLYTLAFSPDGTQIASAGLEASIRLWDARTGEERRRLTGHAKSVLHLAFSPDGKRLASAGADETVRLWDAATGRQIRIVVEKRGSSMSLAFSPDGSLLATGHLDGTVHLWDAAGGTETRQWRAGAMAVRALAFAPDGKTLATGAVWDGGIPLWDVATGREKHPSDEHRGMIDSVRFSPNGRTVISVGRDRRVLWWDLATGMPRRRAEWSATGFSVTSLSPDGETLAVSSWPQHDLRLWDLRSGQSRVLVAKQGNRGMWLGMAYSPDGRFVALAGDDKQIHVWDTREGGKVHSLQAPADVVRRLCFSPDGKTLAAGLEARRNVSGQPTLRLWDIASGEERIHFAGFESIEGSLAFSPDGAVLAAGSGDQGAGDAVVRLWDARTGRALAHHSGHREAIGALTFSPDGKLVASGSGNIGTRDNSVHVWEAATGRLIRKFEGHHSCVCGVAFTPDGLTVASGAGDSTILLWDITGRRSDGRWHAATLTPSELDACWSDLMSEDAAKAYEVVWRLIVAPEQAVAFLRKHLPPVPRPDDKRVQRLLVDLGSDEFAVRQRATDELAVLGEAIAPALRQALTGKPELEARRRLQQLLDQTSDWNAERLRDHRAIQALEHIGTRPARALLEALAAGAPAVRRTEEAKEALRRLTSRQG